MGPSDQHHQNEQDSGADKRTCRPEKALPQNIVDRRHVYEGQGHVGVDRARADIRATRERHACDDHAIFKNIFDFQRLALSNQVDKRNLRKIPDLPLEVQEHRSALIDGNPKHPLLIPQQNLASKFDTNTQCPFGASKILGCDSHLQHARSQ